MTTAIDVFALLGGLVVLVLFGALLWIAGDEAYDMARRWRRERQWNKAARESAASYRANLTALVGSLRCEYGGTHAVTTHRLPPKEQAPAPPAAWSPGLGARCWLLDDATDPASGGRACTVVRALTIDSAPMLVLRYDASDDLVLVSATNPRICRGEAAS